MSAATRVVRAYALEGGGVWDVPGGRRVAFDPTKGGIGNMGKAGVLFNVGRAPDAAQRNIADNVAAAFGTWSVLGDADIRINFVASATFAPSKVQVSWAALAAGDQPGVMNNAAINFDPQPIKLDQTKVLRSDGWNLDYTKVYISTDPEFLGQSPPRIINEYDGYTVAIHEAGHALGLGHPKQATAVMSPQDVSRQTKDGLFQSVASLTKFANQPRKLDLTDLRDGTLAYSNPRANLADDDKLGAKTIYTAPKVKVPATVVPKPSSPAGYTYTYNLQNLTAAGTDYYAREVLLPIDPSVITTNLTAPSGWSMQRDSAQMKLTWLGDTGGEPAADSSVFFSYDSPDAPVSALPNVHWDTPNLETLSGSGGDGSGDAPGMNPVFNTLNFTVMDGTFDYQFDGGADHWNIVNIDSTLVPGTGAVPEPACAGVMILGLGLGLGLLARRRR